MKITTTQPSSPPSSGLLINKRFESVLERRKKEGTLRELPSISKRKSDDKNVMISSSHHDDYAFLIDFSSNDYLGLSQSWDQIQKVESRFQEYLHQQSKSINNNINAMTVLGATGSRLLSGDSQKHHELEKKLAKIHDGHDALLFNSGYDANLSVMSSLPNIDISDDSGRRERDLILMDELCHNSLIMGVRMGARSNKDKNARVEFFRHNDAHHLSSLLQSVFTPTTTSSPSTTPRPLVFVVVESVYSMDGDIAPLKKIFELAQLYFPYVHVIVDEAHGHGIYGKTNRHDLLLRDDDDDNDHIIQSHDYNNTHKFSQEETKNIITSTKENEREHHNNNNENNQVFGGTGVLAALNLEHHPCLLCSVHTFGKAAGCHGAVVISPTQNTSLLIPYLVNYARPFIYSTALSLHSLITIECSYETVISQTIGEFKRKHLFELVRYFRFLAKKKFCLDILDSPSPIQAVMVSSSSGNSISKENNNEKCIQLAKQIEKYGKMKVYPIRYPTVKKGQERIRIIIHSHNTRAQVENLVITLAKGLSLGQLDNIKSKL